MELVDVQVAHWAGWKSRDYIQIFKRSDQHMIRMSFQTRMSKSSVSLLVLVCPLSNVREHDVWEPQCPRWKWPLSQRPINHSLTYIYYTDHSKNHHHHHCREVALVLIWYQHHWSSAGFNNNQITITIILIWERHRRVWKWWDEDRNYPDQDQDRHYCRPLARNALSKTTDSLDLGCAESESERQKTLWEKVKVDGW